MRGSIPSWPIMLRTIYLQQARHGLVSRFRCHWCGKFLQLYERATKDEYNEIYCNDICFNEEADQELNGKYKKGYRNL